MNVGELRRRLEDLPTDASVLASEDVGGNGLVVFSLDDDWKCIDFIETPDPHSRRPQPTSTS